MAASYKKLFKLMIDREIKSKDLAAKAGISPTTLAKMKKDGATVSSDVLVKICTALECTMDDMCALLFLYSNFSTSDKIYLYSSSLISFINSAVCIIF